MRPPPEELLCYSDAIQWLRMGKKYASSWIRTRVILLTDFNLCIYKTPEQFYCATVTLDRFFCVVVLSKSATLCALEIQKSYVFQTITFATDSLVYINFKVQRSF